MPHNPKTGIAASGAYWNPTRVLSDNRIAAFETDMGVYIFVAPEEGQVNVEVTLLFRRAFIELVDQKGWDAPDIVMEEAQTMLSVQPWWEVFFPAVFR